MTIVRGIDVPALTVSDLERALGFYRDLLGLELVERKAAGSDWPQAELARWDAYHERVCGIPGARIGVAFLRAPDGTSLELIAYERPALAPRAERSFAQPGVAVVPLAVRDSAAVVERLRSAGADVVADPVRYELDGVTSYTTYLWDPDGNALCLFEVVEDGS
jgi:catechol 2,3-dioxygenase-like lactoylglutathione lyase family enzyme